MRGGYHIRLQVSKPAQTIPASSSYQRAALGSDAFIPSSIFQSLPAHPPKQTGRRYTFHLPRDQAQPEDSEKTAEPSAYKDYRLGPLRVDWVDFDDMEVSGLTRNASKKEKGQNSRGGPATGKFTAARTKSGSTNLPEGIVHIYREPPQDSAADAAGPSTSASQDAVSTSPEWDGVTLGVLAVPAWMTPSDFLSFVAPAADGMAHLRMIRDSAPNRSIVIIKFRKAEDAAEFAEAYNGKQFNSMEAEICHVVRILSVDIASEDFVGQTITKLTSVPDGAYELPTCPVCLERMDSAVTGLVTVPCSHTFHCSCLSKWGDSRCPVCRYSQTLMSSHPTSPNTSRSNVPIPFTATQSSRCFDCPDDSPSTSNLWICLICGNIGCGRYGRAHARAHYEHTTHLYALELETQRVWDYAGDGYVHRLIQNKADGKLVELPSAASSMTMSGSSRDGGGPSAADALSAEKIEAIGIEYSYLLTSQLDSQRTYYEAQTAEMRAQVSELRTIVERLSADADAGRARARDEEARRRQEAEERVAEAERARAKAERRAEKAWELARSLEKELKGERAVGEGLLKNLAAARERAEAAEREQAALRARVGELEDQLRDVMFFIEARDKIEGGAGAAGEAAGGSLEVAVPAPAPPQNGAARRRKRGKK
ncbi:ring finger and zf-UBP domain-containing protein [Phanerochaete sordida]|uniref:Ring finger and zf-UBP domain-containing protein n=1 Tax=Phanerochaete sordida TaxID=48140 RepID=A0A9P3GAS0_9APHY|nr:ring finger and zf-UBP domain-containing protein [Phanerochaete sordida]